MTRYRVEYEDGSYDIIKCPECNSEDTDHDQDHHLNMICTSCTTRFEINSTDKKITQVTTEPDTEPPAIISGEKAKAQREYEENARRMRKEARNTIHPPDHA
jgi:DNA-directed RNA polymerase subunit RPC12/RpoP